jgi:hypothetical protein
VRTHSAMLQPRARRNGWHTMASSRPIPATTKAKTRRSSTVSGKPGTASSSGFEIIRVAYGAWCAIYDIGTIGGAVTAFLILSIQPGVDARSLLELPLAFAVRLETEQAYG